MNSLIISLYISSLILIPTMATTRAFSQTLNSQQDFLDAHNKARSEVGVQPLVWNDTVANYALHYAYKRYGDCILKHSQGSYGENLAEGYEGFTAVEAVGMWVGEKPNYDYDTNSCLNGELCLHYTQVVWNDTTHLGCARVQCHDTSMFVICSYAPPGNYIGERPYYK